MSTKQSSYPVVDLFAGPGGLGEGFASVRDEFEKPLFHSVASIERDNQSHQTLFLRHFLRSFPGSDVPDDYYSYLSGDIQLKELFGKHEPQYEEAKKSALRISLGPPAHEEVRRIINDRLAGRRKWALVGGPPCQAYSIIGRARMMGNPDFERDERHFLYQEYLKIIIDHQPPVFVMENVKGMLSAKISGQSVINRIVSDLARPKAAIANQTNGLNYSLYSLSEPERPSEEADPRLFLVKAEDYGVPQARHRMFIVGIRSDLNVRPRQLHKHAPPTVHETIGNLPRIRSGLSMGTDDFQRSKGADGIRRWRDEVSSIGLSDIATQLNGADCAQLVASEIKLHCEKISGCPEDRSSLAYPDRMPSNYKVLSDLVDDRLPVLTGHHSRTHMASDLRRYFFASVFAKVISRSPKLIDFPLSLLPDHKNVEEGRSLRVFADRFRVQVPDKVSTTITAHIAKDGHSFIHYDPIQCRSLTVREAARLQTFPDNYHFEGGRTAQYRQVGNAVPPYLAGQIAEIIAEVLRSVRDED